MGDGVRPRWNYRRTDVFDTMVVSASGFHERKATQPEATAFVLKERNNDGIESVENERRFEKRFEEEVP